MKLKQPSNEYHKKYKNSDVRIRKAIDNTLKVFLKNPQDSSLKNKELKPPYKGYRKIKILHQVNDYRIVYEETEHKGEKYAYFIIFGTHKQLFNMRYSKERKLLLKYKKRSNK